jgi:hypothetical protein
MISRRAAYSRQPAIQRHRAEEAQPELDDDGGDGDLERHPGLAPEDRVGEQRAVVAEPDEGLVDPRGVVEQADVERVDEREDAHHQQVEDRRPEEQPREPPGAPLEARGGDGRRGLGFECWDRDGGAHGRSLGM